MGKKRVVLDTNILISALGWDGKPREIVRKILNGEFEWVISQKQVIELQRVLNYPKFDFTAEQKARFLTLVLEVAVVVETHGGIDVIKDDPDDNVIVETAVENDAPFIVTGDDHLLSIKQYNKVKIVTASEFLELSSYAP